MAVKRALGSVRLLVREGDRIVWRTFKGRWLVGIGTPDGLTVLGKSARDDEDGSDYWCILEGAGGKFAAYRHDWQQTGGILEVFDSLAAMRARCRIRSSTKQKW